MQSLVLLFAMVGLVFDAQSTKARRSKFQMSHLRNIFVGQNSNTLSTFEGGSICADAHTRCYDPKRCCRFFNKENRFIYYCCTPYESMSSSEKARRLVGPPGRPLDIYAKDATGALTYTFAPPEAPRNLMHTNSARGKLEMANQAKTNWENVQAASYFKSNSQGIAGAAAAAIAGSKETSGTNKGIAGTFKKFHHPAKPRKDSSDSGRKNSFDSIFGDPDEEAGITRRNSLFVTLPHSRHLRLYEPPVSDYEIV